MFKNSLGKNLPITFLLLFFCEAQGSSQPNIDRKVEWDFNVSSGFYSGGPANKLDIFLDNSGYNWDLKTKRFSPLSIDINRTFSKHLRLGLDICFFKQDLIWKANGTLNTNFKTIIINPYISFNYKNIIFITAGPSINRTSYFHPTGTSLENIEKDLEAGFVIKNTFKYPRKTRIYLQLELLYSHCGTISPYYSIENPRLQYFFTTLRPEHLPLSYFYAGTGLGFRVLRKNRIS